jgi:hypothetical protein
MDALPLAGGRGSVAKATSVEIKLALKTKFGGNGYQIFFEVGDDTGTRVTRHADAVSIGIWPSTGHAVHGFEIKISRGDWLRELADPAKSQSIFRFCHRWSLVTPANLVSADELPPGWGHFTFRDGRLREAVRPARMSPEPPTAGFMAALVRRAGDRDNELLAEIHQKVRAEEEAKREALVERRVEQELRSRGELKSRAATRLAELEEVLGAPLDPYDLKPLARAILAVRRSGLTETWAGLSGILRQLEDARSRIEGAMRDAGFEQDKSELA